jgi:hypothetical protein
MIRPEDIPGFNEYLAEQRLRQSQSREREFLGWSHCIGGIKVRSMAVMDFAVLCSIGNPVVHKIEPLPERMDDDVAMFLRVLQDPAPYMEDRGWLDGWKFGRRIRNCKVPVAELLKQCFAYVDEMMRDAPASAVGGSKQSSVSFVAMWCHLVRSAYKCSEHEVLWMPLPKLFQYLRCILSSEDPNRSEVNKLVDDAFQLVCNLLNSGVCTVEDLKSGKHKVDWNGI